ncbi:MAG: glycosyltransferase [Planctomycetota bacterium]|jgi:glycosyltransferase involved in cell wall biosynthesis
MGSEAGVGWHRVVEAARHFDTWVICEREEFENDILRYLREHGDLPNLHFRFVPRLAVAPFLERRAKPLYYVAYNLWHRRALRVARGLHEEVHFDLVHQLTMCGFREPGYVWKLGVPFVWGPVGGTQNYPWRLLLHAGAGALLKEGLRNIANALQFRLSQRVSRAARRAAVLLAANSVGTRDFRRIHGVTAVRELDVGTGRARNSRRCRGRVDGPLRLLWSGAIGHHRALHLLLRALASLPDGCKWELKVLGSGPLETSLKRLARRLDVNAGIRWMGLLPHDQAMSEHEEADVFVFTSCRDTCGAQVLEALSRGLPVICLDHQGVGDVVTDRCGVKVPVASHRRVVAGLRDAIATLAGDRSSLVALSSGAVERAADFLWERKGERMAAAYRRALGLVTVDVEQALSCRAEREAG